jgi:hypothetical protein
MGIACSHGGAAYDESFSSSGTIKNIKNPHRTG